MWLTINTANNSKLGQIIIFGEFFMLCVLVCFVLSHSKLDIDLENIHESMCVNKLQP